MAPSTIEWRHTVWIAGAVVLRSLGAVCVKKTAISENANNLIGALISPWYALALVCFLLQALTWIMALRKFPLTFAYPFLSIVLILNVVSAWTLFGETINLIHIAGLLLIVLGVVISSLNAGDEGWSR